MTNTAAGLNNYSKHEVQHPMINPYTRFTLENTCFSKSFNLPEPWLTVCLFYFFFFTWYWFYFLFFGSNVFLCLMQRFGFYSCNTKNPATLVMCLTFHMMKTWIQMFWILPSDHSPHRLTYLIHVWCSSTGHTVSLRSPWSCGPDSPCVRCWWPAWSAWPPV